MTRASSPSSSRCSPSASGTAGASGAAARLLRPLAEGEARLDDERVAAVDRGRPRHRGVELALDLLVEPVQDRLLADGREAVRRRRHDLRRLDRLVERLGLRPVDVARPRRPARASPSCRSPPPTAAETRLNSPGEEPGERVALRVVQHLQEHAELDAVGVRLDLARLGRQLLDRARILARLALRREVDERHVRVGDGGLLEVLVHRGAALLVAPLDLERHLGAARRAPSRSSCSRRSGLVLLGVDLDFEVVGGLPRARARDDLHRLAGRELAVHAGGGDADALLAAAHAQAVELRPVEELGEDRRNLLADDAGAVVRRR